MRIESDALKHRVDALEEFHNGKATGLSPISTSNVNFSYFKDFLKEDRYLFTCHILFNKALSAKSAITLFNITTVTLGEEIFNKIKDIYYEKSKLKNVFCVTNAGKLFELSIAFNNNTNVFVVGIMALTAISASDYADVSFDLLF